MGFLSVNYFLIGPLFTAVPVPTHIPSGMSDLCASLIDWSAYLYLCALKNSPSKSLY